MTIQEIEIELKKVTQMPVWGRKQTDDWDKESNFIYHCQTYERLFEELNAKNKTIDFNNYAVHRWYNAMSAFAIENIFTSHANVQSHFNKFDKLIDFSIQGIPFDHKTTVFPRGFERNIEYAKQYPEELIKWLYNKQSTQGRFHLENRLFIVLYGVDGNHWKLRAELTEIKLQIENYLNFFDVNKLYKFEFHKNKITLSDIIWFQK